MDKDEVKARGERIVQWISDHPLISRHMLCQVVGCNNSVLHHAIKGYNHRYLAGKYHDAFEKELSKYGYVPES